MTISFHRLAAPTYIGGLPTGYDYLNDPVANAFPGGTTPAPADTGPLSSSTNPNKGTYFVGFGEDGKAFSANRGFYALGKNTDFIDDFLHANLAVLASADIPVGNPAVVTGTSSAPVFVGPPGTTNDAAGLEQYFHITDQSNNDIVDGSNNQCVVTAVSDGVGTFFVGTLTLTLNITPTVPYRIWYGTRSSLIEMTKGNLIRSSVWGIARKSASLFQFANDLLSSSLSKGASTVGLNTTGFSPAAVSVLNDGGIGTAGISTVRDGFLAVDTALKRRRSFMAVLTDGTTSVGGDLNNPIVDAVFTGFPGGTFYVRPGTYGITDGAGNTSGGQDYSFFGDEMSAGLELALGRTSDFTLSGTLDLQRVGIQSLSATHKRFIAAQGQLEGFSLRKNVFQSGALSCEGGSGGYFILEDSVSFGPALGSIAAALQVEGEARVTIRRCTFTGDSNNSQNIYFATFTDDTVSSITVEDSYFQAFEANVDALQMLDVGVPVHFRNCCFEVVINTGSGYPVRLLNNNTQVTFENCVMRGSNGHCFWSAGSCTHLRGCKLISPDDHPGSATSQMFMINGDVNGMLSTVKDCSIVIGANSVFGNSGTIQKAIVEIGGTNSINVADRPIKVDGLYIQYSNGVTQTHNYTTVLLHGGAGTVAGTIRRYYKNIQFNSNSIAPNNSGTLGGAYRPITGYPTLVTIGGGDTRATTLVDGLHIGCVSNPSVNTNHQVIFASRATLRDCSIDGSLFGSSGSFTRDLVEFYEVDAFNLNLWRTANLNTNQSHLLISKTTRIIGGEFIGRVTVNPFSYIQYGDSHCVIRDFTIQFPSIGTTSTSAVVSCPQQCCEFVNCRIFMDGDWGGRLVNFSGGSDLARVSNNFLFWRRNAGQMLLSSGAGSMVNDNTLTSTNTAQPTFSVTGANSVDHNNNAFLQGGSVASPL